MYISGDLFVYCEEGDPRARVAPDVFVVFGVPNHKRPICKLWEEGEAPAFALEAASRGIVAQSRAEAEKSRAETAESRAEAAEARIAKLEALLRVDRG